MTEKKRQSFSGNKAFQGAARRALPILVRQAKAQQPMYYSQLSAELKYPARGMGKVLGTVGRELLTLSKQWGKGGIPPIQCLVINKQTKLPGRGIGWFVPNKTAFEKSGPTEKRRIMDSMLNDVFVFSRWDAVLKAFGMKPETQPTTVLPVEKITASIRHGGAAESPAHIALKQHVSKHPELVGLSRRAADGEIEHEFESADCIDVLFIHRDEWIGAEVKSAQSPEADIIRGLFQCVKYRVLIEAQQRYRALPLRSRVVLVLEGKFPTSLVWLRNLLGIDVVDDVVVPKAAAAKAS